MHDITQIRSQIIALFNKEAEPANYNILAYIDLVALQKSVFKIESFEQLDFSVINSAIRFCKLHFHKGCVSEDCL